MTQKDKVKELVGRGLHSYHTKSLQQMDRIEKKNKEQNHKISILSNELDNDYLTKTEEGSVVSLEHSKEGMIYLDELQGNTMVNYCTDGSKEMTLNGDIDLEGTFVTTTEGVDNGKVDVMCEGNTLVNLIKYDAGSYCPTYAWEIGETYTMIVEFTSNAECQLYIEENITWAKLSPITNGVKVGYNKFVVKLTIPSNYTGLEKINITNRVNGIYNSNVKFTDIKPIVLKGDWTNKEIPQSHFEGMKSVGQDDENGHKIEILSRNKNILPIEELKKYIGNGLISEGLTFNVANDKIIINGTSNTVWDFRPISTSWTPKFFKFINSLPVGTSIRLNNNLGFNNYWAVTRNGEVNYLGNTITIQQGDININGFVRIPRGYSFENNQELQLQIEFGTNATNYVTPKIDKKEILLNEPLRAVKDYKDRVVKINNKPYIERNCISVTYDGTNNTMVRKWQQYDTDEIAIFGASISNIVKSNHQVICDKLKIMTLGDLTNNPNTEFFTNQNGGTGEVGVGILKTKLSTLDSNGINSYLQTNPITVVIGLTTPIYEPLEVEPTLNTYDDITHISNNSIIPCNMKIKNSGYNAIIKPSTLYTVAIDTNKSGTIGMNLGGVKGTTTNNVLTLTTPATLSDDSLRLYGKGIKGSKVRILEGDKTNWIPSHFEGMKSCFEDKVQEDGTYKMEILSNNKNVLNLNKHNGITTYTHHGITFTYNDKTQEFIVNGTATQDLGYQPLLYSNDRFVTFEQGKQYTLSTTAPIPFNVQISERNVISALTLHPNTMFKNIFDRQNANYCSAKMNYFMTWGISAGDTFNNLKFNLQIEEGSVKTEYIPNKSNKIQFSSIEPLRKLDKFVFKDNMLMVERNNAEKVLNGTENWSYDTSSSTQEVGRFGFHNEGMKGNRSLVICDKYAFKTNYTMTSHNYEGTFTSIGGNTLYLDTMLNKLETKDSNGFKKWLSKNPVKVVYELVEPVYEEIPFELQKIILEGYENGTLFIDTNIPPTVTTTYAGETPIVESVRLNKTEVLNNTTDINDNIIPYLMDMDYRVVCLELATETQGISMARLFGGVYEMLQRDIQSKRYSKDEYKHRLDMYLSINKITEKEYEELGEMLNE